jgi:hypothetical protein
LHSALGAAGNDILSVQKPFYRARRTAQAELPSGSRGGGNLERPLRGFAHLYMNAVRYVDASKDMKSGSWATGAERKRRRDVRSL